MTLNEYQQQAMSTCMESCNNIAYMLTGLNAEVGEINDKIAKAVRKEQVKITRNNLCTWNDRTPENYKLELAKELGDCFWFVAGLSKVLGFTLQEIGEINIDKLKSRKERGVIDGNGDNR